MTFKRTEVSEEFTLCHSCHMKTNVVSSKPLWAFYFVKRMSDEYGYSYEDMICEVSLNKVTTLLCYYGITKIQL
jgi:hypothetical protein